MRKGFVRVIFGDKLLLLHLLLCKPVHLNKLSDVMEIFIATEFSVLMVQIKTLQRL